MASCKYLLILDPVGIRYIGTGPYNFTATVPYDTNCPAGNYRIAVPISCLPCLYDCTTC
jgi:hypothetical protein